MAITGVPTFVDGEIPPASKLNQFGTAITNKFAQAVTTGDLTWDLVCGGNVDFDNTYTATNMRNFWGIINSDEYDTLSDAIDAVITAGGGTILIPPKTTKRMFTGKDITTGDIHFVGCGASSVILLDDEAATGWMFRVSASKSNISFSNLTLQDEGASSQVGIRFQYDDNIVFSNVDFLDWSGNALEFNNNGTAGNACTNVRLTNVRFKDCGAGCISANDINGATFGNIICDTSGTTAISFEANDSDSYMKDLIFDNVRVTTVTSGNGIDILGDDGGASDDRAYVSLNNCHVYDASADGFNIGETDKIIKYVTITGCTAHDSAADGFVVNAITGLISGCQAYSAGATGDGLDLVSSTDVIVTACNFRDAGAYGIDADGTTTCEVIACNVMSSDADNGIKKSNATTLLTANNFGDYAPTAGMVVVSESTYSVNNSAGADMEFLYTVKANTMHIGSMIRVKAWGSYVQGAVATAGTVNLRLENTATANTSVAANDSSTIDFSTEYILYVVALFGASSTYGYRTAVTDDSTNPQSGDFNLEVDWTDDVDFTFYGVANDANATISIKRLSIELLGAPTNVTI